MNKLKIYLDTSIISFLFADDAPDFQQITVDFFTKFSPRYGLYISEVVLLEITKNTDDERKQKMLAALEQFPINNLPPAVAIQEIAKVYLENGVIPVNKVEDALHVGYATFYHVDILLSWNFRHLANINKERRIMVENFKLGYNYPLRLLSPLEVLDEIND